MSTVNTVTLALTHSEYHIQIGGGLLDTANRAVRGGDSRLVVLTDTNVERLGYSTRVAESLRTAGRDVVEFTVPPGEESKSITTATSLWESLSAKGIDRRSVLFLVGGGVVGDLGGFVAATFARGIPFVQVPTTLLAQVDSAVGGKVGINLSQTKNGVGVFAQPREVLVDPSVLSTLSVSDFSSGVGEIAKYALALDASLFDFLETHAEQLVARDLETLTEVITQCCRIKAAFVASDEREEHGRRILLNYGHTFAHAFETLSDYAIPHGHAVALGMRCAARLAQRLGMVDDTFVETHNAMLVRLELPQYSQYKINPSELIAVMKRDKKTEHNKLRLVLPTAIGACEVVSNISAADILAAVGEVSHVTE